MKESRHPHPHIDPRQPRHESTPTTNPPVFAWKPPTGDSPGDQHYNLTIARDKSFSEQVHEIDGLNDPLYLPKRAFAPGRYWWKWATESVESEVFSFEITPDAVVLEVPCASEWLQRFPQTHPRIQIRPDEVEQWRRNLQCERAEDLAALVEQANALMQQPHELAEPDFLPDRHVDYEAFYNIWSNAMFESRRFIKGAEVLGLAYLATRKREYGRAVCRRILSICRWDPQGSSYLEHNDEAHMSVIWNGPVACDWVWELFEADEKERVIEQYRRRGEITFAHMHDLGCYGITRFDSHAGREIIFLAQLALVFHEHIPEAQKWLDWLRPVLCGIWPIWAGDDGAWAEGISYSNVYVSIMSRFASILKKGADVDLYKRPFWKNYLRWKEAALPAYAQWMGFGDQSERWEATWLMMADLSELIARETGSAEYLHHVNQLRQEAAVSEKTPAARNTGKINTTLFLVPELVKKRPSSIEQKQRKNVSQVFTDAGWAAVRTGLRKGKDDIAFIFRSSPFGSISHSHANNNDFIIHVNGQIMAMPSGYYSGYGSAHHAHWVWHTKANNCLTLSDAPQLMRSPESRGFIEAHFEDEHLAYFQGNADLSYRLRAQRCRRHVVFLKAQKYFFLVDEFVEQPGITSSLQWNIHSWSPFDVREDGKGFELARGQSTLTGHFLYHHESFVTQGEGWAPPPVHGKGQKRWHDQHHFRFTPSNFAQKCNLGVVLCPGYPDMPKCEVASWREGNAEIATVGSDLLAVNQAKEMEVDGKKTDALATVRVGGDRYDITHLGIQTDY